MMRFNDCYLISNERTNGNEDKDCINNKMQV